MSKIACTSKGGQNFITAEEASHNPAGTTYYCPCGKCGEPMYFRNGSEGRSACFYGKHVSYCTYRSDSNFDPAKYDVSNFNLENSIKYLSDSTPTGTYFAGTAAGTNGRKKSMTKKRKLCLLPEIHSYMKYNDADDKICGKKIRSMLVDERSADDYAKGINGYIMVEAETSGRFYDPDLLEFHFRVAASKLHHIKLVIKLNPFTKMAGGKKGLFEAVNKQIFGTDYHRITIVIAARWTTGYNNSCSATISSLNQIYIIK